MRADIYKYLEPNSGATFNAEFNLFAIKYFGQFGKGVILSEPAKSIWVNWQRSIQSFSLDVSQNGDRPTSALPHRMSQIKLCALLAWEIWQARPVSKLCDLTETQISDMETLGIKPFSRKPDLATRYPHQMLALSLAETVFHRIQAAKPGQITYGDPASPPYTDHFRKNLCIYLGRGDITPQALYMIFKTMDLFGYLPTAAERISSEDDEPGRDTRQMPV